MHALDIQISEAPDSHNAQRLGYSPASDSSDAVPPAAPDDLHDSQMIGEEEIQYVDDEIARAELPIAELISETQAAVLAAAHAGLISETHEVLAAAHVKRKILEA